MGNVQQGTVIVSIPDHIEIPPEAGKLTPEAVARIPKARRGIGLACEKTAEAMTKFPDRLEVKGIEPAKLVLKGKAAEDIDTVIADLEALLVKLKQANVIIDADAHRSLRKVLAHVRSEEKFDRSIVDLVPTLIAYFANQREDADEEAPKNG